MSPPKTNTHVAIQGYAKVGFIVGDGVMFGKH